MTSPVRTGGSDGRYEQLYRSYLALRREVDNLSTLREIGLAINSTLDLAEALPVIANVVQGALDVRKLTIFQLDPDGLLAKPTIAKFGDDLITRDRLEEESRAVPGTPLGEALSSRSVVLVNTKLQSEAYVPLIAKEQHLGVMRLEERRDGTPFSQDDAELFQLLGSQIAVALNNAHLYAMAVLDGLTKLYVRRYFDLRMAEEFDQAKRYRRVFSLMMFDIDHFKKFNDTYGHQAGDLVLKQFAGLLKSNTRKSDICCRYGGEEMAIILPETALEEAAVLANKLCSRVRRHEFGDADTGELHVTCSIGVSEYDPELSEFEQMVKAADEALYQAKELGRNRVELANI